ncbi:hypothetical protein VNO78_22854 [Psophocarpus tetragonolobus]|uniref:PH domain-containing protein n=1 Tax=Psophocarpus tetragonolobus TaxID=3891 RepID=A0AAN9XDB3_PSOTE
MASRQVLDVPPTNVGGSPFCIAVSTRGMDISKALECSSTWILDFREEEEKASWLKGLVQATYQASTPPSVDVLGDSEGDAISDNVLSSTNSKTADIVINGSLVELKLFIYGKVGDTINGKLDESLILEIVADGGKILEFSEFYVGNQSRVQTLAAIDFSSHPFSVFQSFPCL